MIVSQSRRETVRSGLTLSSALGSLSKVRKIARQSYSRFTRGHLYRGSPSDDIDVHLREAATWLCRAQDAGTDRGVSYGVELGGPFLDSYPETTGYIIPTFLQLSDYYSDENFAARAIEMGNWESEIQLDSGAVMGGMLSDNPTPAVFNTGMVLLGWSALQSRSHSDKTLGSICRARDWLLSMQDADGCWRRGNSNFANPDATLYNVKAAWGLCEAGSVTDCSAAIDGAVRNAEFCVSRQLDNGWFRDCSLTDPNHPLLHTIAYSMQGLLGIAQIVENDDFVDAARRTADGLVDLMDDEGFLPGCIGPDFRGTVEWCCLTGTAQTAIVWGRLFELTGATVYRDAMDKAILYLLRRHDISNDDLRIRGGVPGSWPVWCEYGRMKILNWATNFLVEALLLRRKIK